MYIIEFISSLFCGILLITVIIGGSIAIAMAKEEHKNDDGRLGYNKYYGDIEPDILTKTRHFFENL